MGRRKQQSDFEAWIDVAARLPWWLALTLALVSYLVLHYYAGRTEPPPADMAALGSFAGHQLYRSLALFLQYLIPVIFVAGAVLSAVRRAEQRKRFDETRSRGTSSALLDMSWQKFEGLVAEHFRRQGYAVTQTGGGGPDGGVDLELSKDGERFLVQCKQWRAYKVGVEVVRQLYGVMAARGAVGGFVVTSGKFTEEAQAFGSGRNIMLVDGERLIATMKAMGPVPAETSAAKASTPTCPRCNSTMVRRVAKQGAYAGQNFWGCPRYPQCTGTRSAS